MLFTQRPVPVISFLLATALPVVAMAIPLHPPVPLAGASAVFASATLNNLLGDRDCAGIRFYNVMLDRSQTEATIMAVGYAGDGSDINGGLFAHPYVASAPVGGDPARTTTLSRNAAADGCGNVVTSGAVSYSTTLSKEDMQALLALPGCGGVRIFTADGTTDRLQVVAVSIADGRTTDLGSGGGYERSCGEPCPAACGPPGNYVNATYLPQK